jgi:hypothetical protein
LIHYGGYEAAFLKRMRERYPAVIENPALLEKLTKESVNVLAFIYGQVYFPTYSNSLKDIAGFLGLSWPERDATGVRSIIWRYEWEKSMKSETQQKLRDYNLADCEALEFLAKVLSGFSCPEESARKPQDGNPVFVTAPSLQSSGLVRIDFSPILYNMCAPRELGLVPSRVFFIDAIIEFRLTLPRTAPSWVSTEALANHSVKRTTRFPIAES